MTYINKSNKNVQALFLIADFKILCITNCTYDYNHYTIYSNVQFYFKVSVSNINPAVMVMAIN